MASSKLEERQQRIELQWQYRYIRLIESEQWLKLFFFLGDFKEHCGKLIKSIVEGTVSSEQMLTQFDPRFTLSKPRQSIYLKDNIIIRLAKIHFDTQTYSTDCLKIMNQEMITNNIFNNLFLMFLQQRTMKLRVPLTCMVDYMGWRGFCQADTTCAGGSTLVYGCTQERAFKGNEVVEGMLRKVATHLNLKPYRVRTNENVVITIPLSLHIQVHQARMQKYDDIRKILNESSYLHTQIQKKPLRQDLYIFNLSRIWPMYVQKNLEKNRGFLRPEYVLGWLKPLSNSAFQNISLQVDYEGELDLADACKTLKDERVMQLVKRLDDSEIILVDSHGINTVFHEYGINLRFMGTVAEKSRMGHVKSVLGIEMLAQTLKKVFFGNIEEGVSAKEQLVDFLNLIFIDTPQSEQLFKQVLYPDILDFYDYQLSGYPPNIPGGGLLHAICFHFGVHIKINDYAFFVEPQQRQLFNLGMIGDFVPHATTFSLDTVELKILVEDYKSKKRNNKKQCLKNLDMLIAMNRGLNHKATFTCGAYPEAIYYAEAAEIYLEEEEFERAREMALKALALIPEKHADAVKPYCILIKYESIKGRRGKSLEYYDQALSAISFHLGPNHPLQISAYNVIGFEFLRHNQPQKCQKILKKSFQVCSQTLGYLHISCSQILLQLSTLPLAPSVRLNFLLQCLSILEGLKVDERDIQSVSNRIAELQYQIGDSKSMMNFARKAQNRELQIIAADRLGKYQQVIILCSIIPTTFQDTCFTIQKCFKAYFRLLDSQRARMLWKIYTASLQLLFPTRQLAYKQLQAAIATDHKTISVLIEQSTNILLQNAKRIIDTPEMYIEIENVVARMKDNRLKKMFGNFVMYVSMVGRDEAKRIMQYQSRFEEAWEREEGEGESKSNGGYGSNGNHHHHHHK